MMAITLLYQSLNIFRVSLGSDFIKYYYSKEERECIKPDDMFDGFIDVPGFVILERFLTISISIIWNVIFML